MKGYDAIIDGLRAESVDTVFGLMSEDNMELLSTIQETWSTEFTVVHTRHEQGAVAMADGYSRATKSIGVCSVGRGPAISQTGNALVSARKVGSNLLVIVPAPAYSTTYSKRDIDSKAFEQDAFLKSTIGTVVSVNTPEELPSKLRDAFRRIKTGNGPVAFQIPRDILNRDIEFPEPMDPSITESFTPPAARVHPEPDQIQAAVDLYLDSDATKMPMIVAGMGAVHAGAKKAIIELAERMNAALATTLQAQGFFDDHPYGVGFVGDYGRNLANQFLTESDYIIGVGCSLNPHTTDSGHLFDDEAKLVHIDAEDAAIEQYTNVDIGIVGDARVSVEAVRDQFKSVGIDRSGEFWTEQRKTNIAETPVFEDREFEDQPGTIDPRDLVLELDNLLPENRLVVCDGGHFARWVLDGIRFPNPTDFIWTLEFASIGRALPVGVGATAGESERAVYSFCGDAGFLMSIQELETAVRNHLPLTVIVMNDNALGVEYHNLLTSGYEGVAALMDAPDFASVAESFGATGVTVRSVDDLDDVAVHLDGRQTGPVVVDCKINQNVRHPYQF